MRLSDQLLDTYSLISDQVSRDDVRLVLAELEAVLTRGVAGDVVEFGCYIGTTSLFIRRLLDALHQARSFHVYDSFAGLPAKSVADASIAGSAFQAGELAISKKRFVREFQRAGLQPPIVHKAWFNELASADVPDKIAFAFLDGDFYDSITASLRLVWPRLTPGAAVLIDDYSREALPGVARAVRDFFARQPMPPIRTAHNIAVIRHASAN